jgi:hypothetical protein
MSNKSLNIIWVRILINKNKHFHLNFPLSFLILDELLYCIEDLLTFACILVSLRTHAIKFSAFTLHDLKDLIESTINLLHACAIGESYNLVDITTNQVNVFIKIK